MCMIITRTYYDKCPGFGVSATRRRARRPDDVLDHLPGHRLVAVLPHRATLVAELQKLLGSLDHFLLCGQCISR